MEYHLWFPTVPPKVQYHPHQERQIPSYLTQIYHHTIMIMHRPLPAVFVIWNKAPSKFNFIFPNGGGFPERIFSLLIIRWHGLVVLKLEDTYSRQLTITSKIVFFVSSNNWRFLYVQIFQETMWNIGTIDISNSINFHNKTSHWDCLQKNYIIIERLVNHTRERLRQTRKA